MDALALLALQIDWGADEALDDAPVVRLRDPAPRAAPAQGPATHPSTRPTAVPAIPATPPAAALPLEVKDLEALNAAIRTFEGCPLRETATHPVFAAGDPAGGLLIIGDPPGDAEDRSGQAFSGQVGVFLDRVLPPLGLSRERVMLAHLIPWRPPGNRPPTDAELAQCLPFLHRLIALTAPRHVVLLGIQAARALLPAAQNLTLRRLRGKWAELLVPGLEKPIQALPMHNPATLRTAADRRETWADWRMLHRSIHD
jgi:uracil-DNA glycosylase